MNILILLLFALISPFAALYSLECSRYGVPQTVNAKTLFLPTNKTQILTYLFFVFSAILIFINGETNPLTLLENCFIITLGYIAALTDLFTRRVPNKLVLIMCGTWIFFALIRVFIDFEYGMESLVASALGFLIGAGLMLVIYLISRKGLGAGDVKFMGAVGLYLSYRWVLAVMLVGGVLCLLTAIVMMIMRKIKKSDSLPLIPFLYVGVVITIFFR